MKLNSEEIMDLTTFGQNQMIAAEKAMLDINIVTAKAYPRKVTECLEQAEALALRDKESAEKCWYTLPPFGGKGDPVIGPSIRLAEIIAPMWKNMRYGARPMEIEERSVTAQGYCYDMENNVYYTTIKRRSIWGKNGRYSDTVIDKTMLACCAIAERDAIFKVIPRVFANDIMNKAMAVVDGDVEPLDTRITSAMKFCWEKYNVDENTVCRTIGAQSKDQITAKKLTLLRGYLNAIKDGATTAAEVFKPESTPETPAPTTADGLKEKLAAKRGRPAKAVEPEPQVQQEAPADLPEAVDKATGEMHYQFDYLDEDGLREHFGEKAGKLEISTIQEQSWLAEVGAMEGQGLDALSKEQLHQMCVLLEGYKG